MVSAQAAQVLAELVGPEPLALAPVRVRALLSVPQWVPAAAANHVVRWPATGQSYRLPAPVLEQPGLALARAELAEREALAEPTREQRQVLPVLAAQVGSGGSALRVLFRRAQGPARRVGRIFLTFRGYCG